MPSLLEAIDKKYGKEEAENFDLDLPIAIYVPKKSPRNSIPSLLVLNDCDIETAGDEQELEKKCQGVEELDLAQNKLARWTEVFDILKHMPRVKFVNLSFNNLTEELVNLDNRNPFPYLKNLVLNATHINWKSVRDLLQLLPSLEELHLSLNNYSHVELGDDLDSQSYCNVKKVHFTGNPVTTWREICKLGVAFPTLESLVLAECPLQSLDTSSRNSSEANGSPGGRTESESESNSPPSFASPHNCFRKLKFLNLNSTLLATWDDVERLSRFPALQCLRLQGCPLFEYPQEYTEHERRQLLIARLPNVQTLNGGGLIGEEEREDAERAFIRYYMDKPESDRPERYADLVSVHGKLDPLVHVDLSPEKRVKVRFTFGEATEVRSVVVYQTVQELKQKLESFAGIPASRMRLFYVDQDMKDITGPEEMRYPNKQLYSYNISSGDEIIVDSKQ
ncbi:tubulin-specific chaperone cofactor E-like protein isoform X2 [Periplaneta americana]|uniref:tubulin-specific chaperone cofactor E-like protein isoform X2 n=1 Tax=Periplaneta americana TaxID=6978 RepID=UPI0037E7DBA6